MGKGISYCHRCGLRLLVDDASGASAMTESRRFCAACRPAEAAAPAPAPAERRKSSTTKVRAQGSGARPRETTRIRKRSKWAVALPAAAAVALAVGIALATGASPESRPATTVVPAPAAVPEQRPAAKEEPAPSLDELLARVRAVRQDDLMFERRDEVLRLLGAAAGRAGSRLGEVDLLSAEYDRKFEEAAARLADFTRSEAQRMAAKEKFAEALERLDGYPAAFRTSRSAASLRELRREYVRRRGADAPAPAAGGVPPSRLVF
jgi:hypothetical protein